MAYAIKDIEGIGPAFGEKLAAAGIKTTTDLLEKAGAASGRKKLADETGLPAKSILSWVNMADLFRISGVGSQYAELLEKAGVDTVKELRNRNAANLAAKMAEVQAETKVAKRAPSEKEVTGWVAQAKELDPVVTY